MTVIRPYPESLCAASEDAPNQSELLAFAMTSAATAELRDSLATIGHCIAQLSVAQIWHRPGEDQNSIGNLLLHLEGNLRQWIVAGLTGGHDARNRPDEFSARQPLSPTILLASLEQCVAEAVDVLGSSATATQLLAARRIQGFQMTGVGAIEHSVSHFRGHTQEIVGRTRQMLGSAYVFAWVPANPEQGRA